MIYNEVNVYAVLSFEGDIFKLGRLECAGSFMTQKEADDWAAECNYSYKYRFECNESPYFVMPISLPSGMIIKSKE